jgi:hypothetical protein
MPGSGKSFDQFRADDKDCRQFASDQLGGESANSTAVNSGLASAAVGTLVGAAAGAAIGGHNGAGVGAGTGLLMGSMAGTGAAQAAGRTMQQRYDYSYEQCMYAKGERVPVSGRFAPTPYQSRPSAYQPSYNPPPPPPGYYPQQ